MKRVAVTGVGDITAVHSIVRRFDG